MPMGASVTRRERTSWAGQVRALWTPAHQTRRRIGVSESTKEPRSGPELALEVGLGLVQRACVGAGREVLPSRITDHQRHVGATTFLRSLGRHAERGMQDRTGRDAGEDALVVEQLTDPAYGVPRPYRETRRQHRLVVELR